MKKVFVLVSALFAIYSFASEPNLKCSVYAHDRSSGVTKIHKTVGERFSGCRDNNGKPLLCLNSSASINIEGSDIYITTTSDKRAFRVNFVTNTGTEVESEVPYILNLANGDLEGKLVVGDKLKEFIITCLN